MKKKIFLNISLFIILLYSISFLHAEAINQKLGYKITKTYDVVPNDPNGNKKVILLTIDDGPTSQSSAIVKILQKENVKVIFFINGMHVKNNLGKLQEEVNGGNMIGNHTWDHTNLKTLKDVSAQKEIDQNSTLIKKETGQAPRFFRSPYGVNTTFAIDYIKKNGMIMMNWSDAAIDWDKKTHDKKVFIANVLAGLHPGAIILMHEHPWSANALDDMIITLKSKGYTFVDPSLITQ